MHSFSQRNAVAAAAQLPVNGAEKSRVRVPLAGTELGNHVLLLSHPVLTHNSGYSHYQQLVSLVFWVRRLSEIGYFILKK